MEGERVGTVERLVVLAKIEDEVGLGRIGPGRERIKPAGLFQHEEPIRAGQGSEVHRIGEAELWEYPLDRVGRRRIWRPDDAVGIPRRPRRRGQEQCALSQKAEAEKAENGRQESGSK